MASSNDQRSPQGESGKEQNQIGQWYGLAGIGIEFIVAILLVGGIGWWFDTRLGTRPWLMLAGGALGFAAGLWLMLKAAFRAFRK